MVLTIHDHLNEWWWWHRVACATFLEAYTSWMDEIRLLAHYTIAVIVLF